MQQTCGSCGKPVSARDITCPHCDALLAAYASPLGATSATTWAGSEPFADAVPPVKMDEPAPAATIEMPDEVEAVSSAPRPLFDTNVTIDELMRAAEGDHDDNLVVVDEEKVASKPVVFDSPDYARPPSAAEPVPVVEEADPGLIARPADEPDTGPPAVPVPMPEERATAPAGETWLAETLNPAETIQHDQGHGHEDRERKERVTEVRGRTEEYLRKLHAQSGYDSSRAALSRPVDAKTSGRVRSVVGKKANDVQAVASLERSRKGCSSLLVFVLFFLWLGVVGGILTGDLNPGLLFVAVALSFLARFLGKPFNLNVTGKK